MPPGYPAVTSKDVLTMCITKFCSSAWQNALLIGVC